MFRAHAPNLATCPEREMCLFPNQGFLTEEEDLLKVLLYIRERKIKWVNVDRIREARRRISDVLGPKEEIK